MNHLVALRLMAILVWATVGVMVIGAVTELTGHNITLNNFPVQLLGSEASPTPQQNLTNESNAVISISPSITQQTQHAVTNTNQNNTITHDGTRTGPIVDYYSYCEQKTIKVYENERIPFKLLDGSTVYSTQGDIDCYNSNHQNTSYTNNQTSNNCEAGPGNWVHAVSLQDCQSLQQQYYVSHNTTTELPASSYQDNRISCPIDNYCNGNPQVFLFDPATCTTQQNRANDNCEQEAKQNQQLLQQQAQEKAQFKQNCIGQANASYNYSIKQCNSSLNYVNGQYADGGFCISSAERTHSQAITTCNNI